MGSTDNDATYAGIKACVASLGTNSPQAHTGQSLLLSPPHFPCIPALLLFLGLAQHPCARHVNLPFAQVSKDPQLFAYTVPGIAANNSVQLHLYKPRIHVARMRCCCVMTSTNFTGWYRGTSKSLVWPSRGPQGGWNRHSRGYQASMVLP